MKDKLSELIKAGKINLTDCVVLTPKEMYEQLLKKAKVEDSPGVLPYVYFGGVRIMWANIPEPILVTKEVFNQKYNSCDFVKLI